MLMGTGAPVRAKRFPVHLHLDYRGAGEQRWHGGTTENVSRSGILLRGRYLLPPDATIEISVAVPPRRFGRAPLHLLCRGRVARISERKIPLLPCALGIRVADYELVDTREVPAREPRPWPSTVKPLDWIHDFNNLVTIVLGCSELILSDPSVEVRPRELAVNIHEAAQRIAGMVQQLGLREPGKS
jgi:hypothetical protein